MKWTTKHCEPRELEFNIETRNNVTCVLIERTGSSDREYKTHYHVKNEKFKENFKRDYDKNWPYHLNDYTTELSESDAIKMLLEIGMKKI